MTAFDCNRCGACCRSIGNLPGAAALDRGDGVCRHLRGEPGDEHACAIYESRPKVCRIDESCPPPMEMREWYRRNEIACGLLRLRVYGQGATHG